MSKIAVFPGSFDPFTLGHQSLVLRALPMFDNIIIGVGTNSKKQYLFSEKQRLDYISEVFAGESKVEVRNYQGLTVDFCQNVSAGFILRGIRNARDFEFENEIAQMNNTLNAGIETVFLASLSAHSAINSTIVREIYKNGGDVSAFLPADKPLPDRS